MISISPTATRSPPPRRPAARPSRERCLIGFVALWLVLVMGGVACLYRYALVPGPAAAAPAHWSNTCFSPLVRSRHTLVMVVRPDCPCSRASLSELAVLAANCKDRVAIDIVFAELPGQIERVNSTDLWRSAMHLPGTTLIADQNRTLSRALGATTSGQVYLFDSSGVVRFSGGITDSRGHAGSNTGRSALEAILEDRVPATTSTPVFGCALW